MKDIKLLKTCEHCGEHITLMESIRADDVHNGWLVERCLSCGCHPVTEVVRLYLEPSVECRATIISEFLNAVCARSFGHSVEDVIREDFKALSG